MKTRKILIFSAVAASLVLIQQLLWPLLIIAHSNQVTLTDLQLVTDSEPHNAHVVINSSESIPFLTSAEMTSYVYKKSLSITNVVESRRLLLNAVEISPSIHRRGFAFVELKSPYGNLTLVRNGSSLRATIMLAIKQETYDSLRRLNPAP